MKKYINWLLYLLAFFAIIIIMFVLYHAIDPGRIDRQKKVYEERLEYFKKEKANHSK